MALAISLDEKVIQVEKDGATLFKAELSFVDKNIKEKFLRLVEDELAACLAPKVEKAKKEELEAELGTRFKKKVGPGSVSLIVEKALLEGYKTTPEIAKKYNLNITSLPYILNQLIKAGKAKKVSRGVYEPI